MRVNKYELIAFPNYLSVKSRNYQWIDYNIVGWIPPNIDDLLGQWKYLLFRIGVELTSSIGIPGVL